MQTETVENDIKSQIPKLPNITTDIIPEVKKEKKQRPKALAKMTLEELKATNERQELEEKIKQRNLKRISEDRQKREQRKIDVANGVVKPKLIKKKVGEIA